MVTTQQGLCARTLINSINYYHLCVRRSCEVCKIYKNLQVFNDFATFIYFRWQSYVLCVSWLLSPCCCFLSSTRMLTAMRVPNGLRFSTKHQKNEVELCRLSPTSFLLMCLFYSKTYYVLKKMLEIELFKVIESQPVIGKRNYVVLTIRPLACFLFLIIKRLLKS